MQLIQSFNYYISGPSKILEEKGVRKQIFEGRYKFKLSPQQASQITLACDQRVEAKMAFPVQVSGRWDVVTTYEFASLLSLVKKKKTFS